MSSTFVYIASRPCDKLEGRRQAISMPFITTTPVGDKYKSSILYNIVAIKDQCCVLYTNPIVIITVDYDVLNWLSIYHAILDC